MSQLVADRFVFSEETMAAFMSILTVTLVCSRESGQPFDPDEYLELVGKAWEGFLGKCEALTLADEAGLETLLELFERSLQTAVAQYSS